MRSCRIVALLGRRDSPTDAVEDYSRWLGSALEPHGWVLELCRVPWADDGWLTALRSLRREVAAWRDARVLVQYTALAWSRQGFPFGFLVVLQLLARCRVPFAVVYHDPQAYSGERTIDALRRACQNWVMRRAYEQSDRAIFTLPLEKVSWLGARPTKAIFIPVGANLPEPVNRSEPPAALPAKTVAVFDVTGGARTPAEVRDIAYAVNRARQHVPSLRLVVFGRNSLEAKEHLERALNGRGVNLSVRGLLPAEEIARELSFADVLLFVRGHVSSGRSSAIAGIAYGLPVVGYLGPHTAFPVTAAGVALVPYGDVEALSEALRRVLVDEAHRRELRARSRAAWRQHFSWSAIATRYLEVLGHG